MALRLPAGRQREQERDRFGAGDDQLMYNQYCNDRVRGPSVTASFDVLIVLAGRGLFLRLQPSTFLTSKCWSPRRNGGDLLRHRRVLCDRGTLTDFNNGVVVIDTKPGAGTADH